jgi:glycerophosphoryl diester phosphodiesterase
LDLRLSSDDQLFVLHDADLKRTTLHSGNAQQLTLAEVQSYDARHAMSGWQSPCPVPSLQQVLDSCPDNMRFQLEVKADRKAPLKRLAIQLAKMVRQQALEHRVVITSSSKRFLSLMREAAPEVQRGYVSRYRRNKPIQTALALECRWLIGHFSVLNENLMDQAREHGLGVSAWTVNDLKEAERLISIGVDSIVTDFPTAFIAHLKNRV